MNYNDKVKELMYGEIDKLNIEKENIEVKITKLINKGMFDNLEKIYKLKKDIDIIEAQIGKLYELVGKIDRVIDIGNE